jgi:hypothetical protein
VGAQTADGEEFGAGWNHVELEEIRKSNGRSHYMPKRLDLLADAPISAACQTDAAARA